MTALFQALNDDTRRSILELLRVGDLSAGAIAEKFHLGKPTVSHHLDLLKRAGLVTSEKRGQFVIYSLTTSVLEDALHWLVALTKDASPKFQPTNAHEKPAEERMAPAARTIRPRGVPPLRLATDS